MTRTSRGVAAQIADALPARARADADAGAGARCSSSVSSSSNDTARIGSTHWAGNSPAVGAAGASGGDNSLVLATIPTVVFPPVRLRHSIFRHLRRARGRDLALLQ